MQTRNVYAGPYLDRVSHQRQDAAWFASAVADPGSRVVPVWNSRSLIVGDDEPRAAFIGIAEIPPEQRGVDDLILLGRINDAAVFAYECDCLETPQLVPDSRFEDLRAVAALLPAEEAGLLGYARAMIWWRRRHRYCGTCGARTVAAKGGHVRLCTNESCRHEQFPRLDPAIIVLVSDGQSALLGRQASWPAGRYSTIAGFVEPGESLEDAVSREVLEETGVMIDTVDYHSSQPWPFPASLMLGFTAHAVTRTIYLHDEELEDAKWFTREDIAAGGALLPPRQSISFRLIAHWFDAGNEGRLSDIHDNIPWPAPR